MPTVPTYQRQTQDRMAPGNTSTLRLPQNNAMTALADVGVQALDVYQQKKNQQDLAQGQEALLALNQYADDLYSHPQTGLLTKQGKNAIGQAQASIDLLQNKAEELYSALPDGPLKEKFFAQFQEVGLNNGRRFRGYEIGQTQDYEAGNFKGLLNNLQQQEIAAFDDPQTAEMVRRNRQQAIEQYGQVHGWSQEKIIAEMAGADHKTLLQQAQNYAVAHPERWLNGDFLSRQTGGMDMRAIAMVESNGRHVRPDGSLVTSDEGAQGKYQLMPETGRYLAEKRGVTYDPADEAQHALLARDYANALYEKYDSETLAGAAYNWGPGHVDKLIAKVGDPRKGDISEAEFINHLPQHTQGWLNRYRKNKTGLDPVALNRIDNLAAAQLQQQREALRAQVDPVINNTLAQLYNGDVPDAMPDKRTIMAAYGDQGEKWVKQLDIAIDNAMKFQAIQYIPPAQQQEEIDQMKPQANDPDYALKLDAYGKLKSLVKKSNETIKAQRDTRKFNDALVMGEKLDPNDKAMQSAASATSAAQNFRIHDGTTHDDIFIQVAQTGIIPAQVTSQLTAISRASSPDLVAQGADLFDRLHGADQSAIGDLPKEMRGFYMTVKQLKDAGMAVSDAVKAAQDATYRQSEMLKAQLASTQGTTEYRKVRTKAMESAVSSMSQWFRRDPAANDGTPEARDFRNDYQILYDIHYRASGGNAEVAKKMTNQEIARNWMISEVNGSAQFMKYAPEALYRYGPEGWQAAQWKEEKQRLMYGESEDTITTPATQVGITSGRAAFIQSKTPESRIGGDLEIVADISTPKTGDYAVVIKDKDSAGIVRSQLLTDKYGQPRRWKPSLADWPPYQKMEEERKQDDQKRVMLEQAHKGFKDKHRALKAQYQRLHDERVNQVDQYFSWGEE